MDGLSPMRAGCEAEGEPNTIKGSAGAIITLIGQPKVYTPARTDGCDWESGC